MVNWYAVGLAATLLYIIPKRLIYEKLMNYYKYRALLVPSRTVIVILDDIGLNYEKARTYAKLGSRIIIGCSDRIKMEQARKELIKLTKNRDIVGVPVNCRDKMSLKSFAQYITSTEIAVDSIINNRGKELNDLNIIFKTQELAKERLENHCLHFLYHIPEDL